MLKVRVAALAAALSILLLTAAPTFAATTVAHSETETTTAETSSNWAGYVATRAGTHFSSVGGSWIVPTIRCAASTVSYSSTWIGIGGNAATSQGLEQAGTDADCGRSGRVYYSAWYELIPAVSVSIPLQVTAGDRVTAAVKVSGHRVSFRLTDLSTGAGYARTVTAPVIDTTSAEWIVENPTICNDNGRCYSGKLADFGTLGFSAATATAARAGRAGTIASAAWTARPVNLTTSRAGTAHPATATAPYLAATSALSSDGTGFSVSYGGA